LERRTMPHERVTMCSDSAMAIVQRVLTQPSSAPPLCKEKECVHMQKLCEQVRQI